MDRVENAFACIQAEIADIDNLACRLGLTELAGRVRGPDFECCMQVTFAKRNELRAVTGSHIFHAVPGALEDGARDAGRQMLAGPFVDRQFDGLVGCPHFKRIRRQAGNAGSNHGCAKQTFYCFHRFFPLFPSVVRQLCCRRWIFVNPWRLSCT